MCFLFLFYLYIHLAHGIQVWNVICGGFIILIKVEGTCFARLPVLIGLSFSVWINKYEINWSVCFQALKLILMISCTTNPDTYKSYSFLVLLAQNIVWINLRAWKQTLQFGSYLLVHILKLNPIKTGNLAKQVPSTFITNGEENSCSFTNYTDNEWYCY